MILRSAYDWLSNPSPAELRHRLAVVIAFAFSLIAIAAWLHRRFNRGR